MIWYYINNILFYNLHDLVTVSEVIKEKNDVFTDEKSIIENNENVLLENSNLTYSEFSTSVFCSRHIRFYLFNVILFNFIITAISTANFSISPELVANRLASTLFLILTSVNFKWTSNQNLPTIAYMTLLDKYQIACIVYMFLTCIAHTLLGSSVINLSNKNQANIYFFIAFASLFVLFHILCVIQFFFTYSKIFELKKKEIEFKKNRKDRKIQER